MSRVQSVAFTVMLKASSAKNEHRDCTVKALTAATGCSYEDCHAAMKAEGRKNRQGSSVWNMTKAATRLGFKMDRMPPHEYRAKTMITVARDRALKCGAYIVSMSGHVAAVVDGDVIDWTSGRQHRVQTIYRVTGTAIVPVLPVSIKVPSITWRPVPSQLGLFA